MQQLNGQSIGRYHILEQIGRGGMAVVYKAYDTHLERDVAVKLIRKEAFGSEALERILKRFEREARALAKLSHANIIKIFDYGDHEGAPYLVMEYMPGGTLKECLGQPMSPAAAARLLAPIAKALVHSHQEGIIHRDIKPSNILIDQNGDPKLTDFGIAYLMELGEETALTATGVGMGTPEYMAPEQGLGKAADERTDIYALGVILYEMVTGHKPFQADTPLAVVIKHVNDPLPRPRSFVSDLPKNVEGILFKALAKEPDSRFPDMDSVAEMLEGIGTGRGEAATPRGRLTRRIIVGVGALGIAVLIGYYIFSPMVDRFRVQSLASNATPTQTSTLQPSATQTTQPSGTPTPSLTASPTFTLTSSATPTPIPTLGIGSTKVSPNDEMVLAYVTAGEYLMGSERGDYDERPVHAVYLDAFWMDQTEVTNSQYRLCVQNGICSQPGGETYADEKYANYPVVEVSWEDAQAYCEWAGRRLPTEAEWEKAARGGKDGKVYPWGDELQVCTPGSFNACDQATFGVGRFSANVFGLYDLSGNVWEWVGDWYATGYYAESPQTDPRGPDSGSYRIRRGGSWLLNDWGYIGGYVRVADRFKELPNFADEFGGFRCALSASELETTISSSNITGQLAFATNRDGNWEIYSINGDGSALKNLSNNPGKDDGPAWSPDGSTIAFSSDRNGNSTIFLMDAEGITQTKLTNGPVNSNAGEYSEKFPIWSVDGNFIVYTFDAVLNTGGVMYSQYFSDREGNTWGYQQGFDLFLENTEYHSRVIREMFDDENWEILVEDADGTNAVNLTNHPADDRDPVWSPDGEFIAFVSDRDGNQEIYIMRADGSDLTNLTNNPADDQSPDWNPLGDSLIIIPTSTPTSTPIVEITVDGNKDDWEHLQPFPLNFYSGSTIEMKDIFIHQDDEFFYVMIELAVNPLSQSVGIELNMSLRPGGDCSRGHEFHSNFRIGKVAMWEKLDGECHSLAHPFSSSGTRQSWGEVIEIQIPLLILGETDDIHPVFINIHE